MNRQPRSERHPQAFRMELGRVQPADIHPHGAAAVAVAADLVALLGIGGGICLDAQPLRQRLGAAGHLLVLFESDRALELAD